MNPLKYSPEQLRKASTAAVTLGANLIVAGVLTGTLALVVQAFISAAGVYGVFVVSNKEV